MKQSLMKLFQQHSFLCKAFVIPTDLIVNNEYFFVEINLRKKKWLLCCSYNPHKNSISTHIDFLRRELDLHSSNYEYIKK